MQVSLLSMNHILLQSFSIGLAGALGAGSRHTVAKLSHRQFGNHFPWGTLLINLTGSVIIGFCAGMLARHTLPPNWYPMLVTGFLGGYTTFSTLSVELARLRRSGHQARLTSYIVASFIVGPLCAYLGYVIGYR
jgi:fluoride exporter